MIRLLAVVFMMPGVFGGGSLAYADGIMPHGSGTEGDPYRISSADEWKYFENLTENYAEKYFKLTADITVTTIFAKYTDSNSKRFAGMFDGNGHTLTFNMGSSSSPYDGEYCAPFGYVGWDPYNTMRIKNLKVKGEIFVSNKFAAGLVGYVYYPLDIQNCSSSLVIRSSVDGDGSHGGLVGLIWDYVTLTNCIFDGKLIGSGTTKCSGFVGIDKNASKIYYPTFSKCIFEPSSVTFSSTESKTFTRCASSNISYVSCYYKKTLGGAQGTDASSMTDSELYTALNDHNNWVMHAGTLYLKPFQQWVDITGWKSESGAPNSENPTVNGNRADNNSDRYVTYTYYEYGKTDGSADYPTTKGHYTVKASVPGGTRVVNGITDNWSAWESTMNFCVYDPPTGVERDYDPNDNSLLSIGSIDVGTFYYRYKKDDGSFSSWSEDVPTETELGTYTIEYYIKGNETHNDIGSTSSPAGSFTSTIQNKTVSEDDLIITLEPSSYTYDNTEKTPTVTVKDGSDTIDPSEYTVSYSNNKNAGTATVTITDKSGGNYTVNGTTTFTIEKEQLTATVTANTLTYNTNEQTLVSGSLSGTNKENCSLKYSVDNVNYSTKIPKGVEAKTYTVYYKAEGDTNHKGIDAATVEVTINAKTVDNPTITVSPSSFTYDGSEKKPDVTVKDESTEISSSEYSVSYSNNKDVGTATVTITDNDGGNYTVSGTATFSIVKEGSTYTPPTAKTGLTYTGEAQELLTAGSTTTGTMQYSFDGTTYSTDIPTGTNAKTYKVYYKVVGDNNHDDTSPVSMSVTISRRTVSSPTITVSPSSYTYDGKAKKPSVTVKDVDTVIPSSEYTVSYSNNTNVGTATVTVSNADGGNYIVNGTASFSIVEADGSYTAPTAKTGLVYNGSAQELITAGSSTTGTMQYSLDDSTYGTDIPAGIEAKEYAVYYKVVDDDNHESSVKDTLYVTISAMELTNPTIVVSPSSYTYDGTAKKPSVTVKDGSTQVPSSEYSVSYSNNTNVGTATVTITDNDGGNYIVSGTASFYILSEGSTYTPPTAKTGLTYTGEAQELLTAGSTTTGTMQYSSDGKTYSTDIPTGTNAKTYKVYYKVVGDDNHDSTDPVSIEVTISRRVVTNPTITLESTTYVYDGTAKEPAVTVTDGDDEIPNTEYTVSYQDNVEIGTASVIVSDKDGGNYNVTSSTTNFSIIPKRTNTDDVSPTAKTGLEYNGESQELVNAGSSSNGTIKYSLDDKNYSTDIPTATDAGTYKVYYKVWASDGSVGEAQVIKVTINPKAVTISIELISNGPERTPTIKVYDEDGNKLSSDAYSIEYKDSDGNEVTPLNGRMEAGDYVAIVTPTGNYGGPTLTESFHVRGPYTFVFTMEADIIGVCLPYDRVVPEDYYVYYFDRVDETGNPVFKRILLTKLTGGEPYLLKYVGSSSARSETRGTRTIDLSPVNRGLIDLSIPIKTLVNKNMVFTGTFDDLTNSAALTEGAYILQADKTWKPVDSSSVSGKGGEVCLDAFLTYIRYKDRTTPSNKLVTKQEDTYSDSSPGQDDPEPDPPSAVNTVIFEDENGNQEWYDFNGRRIEAPQKGVNILRTSDGKTKKVVKK